VKLIIFNEKKIEILKHVTSVSSKDEILFSNNQLVSGVTKKQALVKAHGK
jgi:hypothetical protein